MAAINEVITLGIGTPAGIPPFVLVGLGPSSGGVTVPDVVGNDQATATSTLEGDGFVVAVQNAYSGSVLAGNVISQDPVGGSSAPSGSTVTIVVSIGAAPAAVPNVRSARNRGIYKHIYGRG